MILLSGVIGLATGWLVGGIVEDASRTKEQVPIY